MSGSKHRRDILVGLVIGALLAAGWMVPSSVAHDTSEHTLAQHQQQAKRLAAQRSTIRSFRPGVAVAGLTADSNGNVLSWFNRFDGEPVVDHDPNSPGEYGITFPGVDLNPGGNIHAFIHQATEVTGVAGNRIVKVGRTVNTQGDIAVVVRDLNNNLVDRPFSYIVFQGS